MQAAWGDGFAEDGLTALAAVHAWDDLHSDQLVRLYPHLAARGGPLPDTIAEHLRGCLAARAFWMQRVWAMMPEALHSMNESEIDELGGRWTAVLFGTPRSRSVALSDADRASEAADLAAIDAAVGDLMRSRTALATPIHTGFFAYLTGLHPAYIWPSALLTHERDTTAGWLGVLARGRPAYMPAEVADVLWESMVGHGLGGAVRGLEMLPRLAHMVDLAAVWRTAEQVRQGMPSSIVHPRSPRTKRWRPLLQRLWAPGVTQAKMSALGGSRP